MPATANIVVVDDNPATLYSTSRVLRSAGWTVQEAKTGNEGFALVLAGCDLAVLDIHLPDIDGFEICRRIRSTDSIARTPVIHLSATFVKDMDKVQGFAAGGDGYLTHPVEPPVLIATVNAFLRTRQAESEMRESEAKFRAVFDQALNGIALLGEDLVFRDVNPAMSKMLHGQRAEIIGRRLADFLSQDDVSGLASIQRQMQQPGGWQGVFALRRADGQVRQLEWNMSTHSLPNVWLAIVSDVTARHEFEREREQLLLSERAARTDLERANRLKDEFLATLSHELRTPLNAIVGWSQLMRIGNLNETDRATAVETIERNAHVQAKLISDLLDVARITSGKLRLDVQLVDPAAVVEAALGAVLPAAEAKGIRISKVLDPQAGPIAGDPARLQQVVWNLVNNAVKFTPKGGKIQVTVKRINSHVEIDVSDDGDGISTEMLQQIFERFHQGDSGPARTYGGLGIGLAIARQLVEMHGGKIQAESAGKGQGARFTVLLPISPIQQRQATVEAPAREGATPTANEGVTLAGLRVLIVDDDSDARMLLRRIVTDGGASTLEAGSAAQGLKMISDFKPHVLISDLGMPEQDGFAFIRQVRAKGLTHQELPAIALTAFARTEDRRRALLAGFQMHVAKPVDPRELTAIIATLVGRTGSSSAPA